VPPARCRRRSPSGELTGAQRAALEAGEELGMQTTPGYKTGNKALQKLEAKLESQPWTSGPFDKLKRNNIEKTNEAWAKAIGEKGKSVDSTVLNAADERLGNNFEKARSPDSVVKVDPKQRRSFWTISTRKRKASSLEACAITRL
jgi:hypothetical protein